MSAPPSLPTGSTRATRADRWLVWFLALVPVICACSGRDLWAPDEPRYGQVAREMLASGNLLVPHVNGAPYAEKPPLYWWGVTALSAPLGRVTAVTARLGAALYALGCVLLLAALVRRWFRDAAMGVTAAALFASMVFVIWNGGRAGLDLPLTFYILLAIECGDRWMQGGHVLPALGLGVAWAGAILVKGPLGFLFPPLALAAGAVLARSAPSWRNPGWWLAPLVMAALCLAWLLPAVEAGGAAYENRLLGQIRGRATGAGGGHVRPLYYYLYNGVAVALPWSLHLLAGLAVLALPWRAPADHRRGLGSAAAIGLIGFVFLSLVATKRQVYLIPLLPFVSVGTAYALHTGRYPRIERLGRWVMIGAPIGMALFLLALPLVARRLLLRRDDIPDEPVDASAYLTLVPAALLFLGAAWAGWRARQDPRRAVRRVAAWIGGAAIVMALAHMPRADRLKSFAAVAQAAEQAAGAGTIYNAGFGQGPNLLWSLDRERTPVIHGADDLLAALPAGGPPAAVVAERRWWETLRAGHPERLVSIHEVWREAVDNRTLVVLTNREP